MNYIIIMGNFLDIQKNFDKNSQIYNSIDNIDLILRIFEQNNSIDRECIAMFARWFCNGSRRSL